MVRTEREANVVQAVEERQPVWFKYILLGLGIENTKLPVKGVHRLGSGEGLVVEAIVESRHGNHSTGESQACVEDTELGEDTHRIAM